jgi:hypothetical protein
MKPIGKSATLITAPELAEIVGADQETVNNWIRRGIISRVPIGGRQLKARLFSTDEVYKAALTNELVRLGIGPSSASEAANSIWNVWEKNGTPKGQKVYAIAVLNKDRWTVELCWRKPSGGPLYKLGRAGGKLTEIELPDGQAFAVVPIIGIFDHVNNQLSTLLQK